MTVAEHTGAVVTLHQHVSVAQDADQNQRVAMNIADASARALSGQADFALVPVDVNAGPAPAAWRGAADAQALRARFSDANLFNTQRAPGVFAGTLQSMLEQLRVETLGCRRYRGCRANLKAFHEEAATSLSKQARLAQRVVDLLRERLAPEDAVRDASAPWRATLEALINSDLDRLATLVDAQQPFHALTYKLAGDLDHYARQALAEMGDVPASTDEHLPQAALFPDMQAEGQVTRPDPSTSPSSALDVGIAGDEDGGDTAASVRGRTNIAAGIKSDYKIYTRAFDQVAAAAALCPADQLALLRRELDKQFSGLQGAVPRLANRLQRLVRAQQKRWWDFDFEEGVLDAARLARVIIHPSSTLSFKQEKQSAFRDTVVTLLIDNSGSMRGQPVVLAMLAAELLTRALERCGVKVEVLGYTTREWNGGAARTAWVAAGQAAKPGRLNDLLHIVYKSADMPWRRMRASLGLVLHEQILKENIDGEALLWAHQRLAARGEQRRILIVIADGAPADNATFRANGSTYLDAHLHAAIDQVHRAGMVDLRAIGINFDVAAYYPQSIRINDASELGGTVVDQLISLFETPKKVLNRLRMSAPIA